MKNSEDLTAQNISERTGWEYNRETARPTSPLHITAAASLRPTSTTAGWSPTNTAVTTKRPNETTPLAKLVRERLAAMGIRQSEFCRLYRFDQGLLSKIQNSVITNLSLESVLRLAVGLSVPPTQIMALIEREDLHELVVQAYGETLQPSVSLPS